jgi:hypothetical protein
MFSGFFLIYTDVLYLVTLINEEKILKIIKGNDNFLGLWYFNIRCSIITFH